MTPDALYVSTLGLAIYYILKQILANPHPLRLVHFVDFCLLTYK